MVVLRAALGLVVLCVIAWLLSSDRKRIPWRTVFVGIALQFALGFFILYTTPGIVLFHTLAEGVIHLINMTKEGTDLVFGKLSNSPDLGFIFAFAGNGLPAIIFFSALMAILYYFGVMQTVIWVLGRGMMLLMRVSGAEAMCMAANIFVGQTEAGLTIKRYIPRLTMSELNSMMTGGFATMSAGMIAVYTGVIGKEYGTHLLTAVVMSAPAAFVTCKLIRPEHEEPETGTHFPLKIDRDVHNVFEAAASGTHDGLILYLNVIAMLIAFTAMLALINWPLGAIGNAFHMTGALTLSRIFGWILSPIAWIIGIGSWTECQSVGSIIGLKMATNEFLAFLELSKTTHLLTAATTQPSLAATSTLSWRSSVMTTYAIADFANFVSIGIQIGGFTPMAPLRKTDFAKLVFRAMIGGCLASWMTATIAGMFV